ncbi:hypothetical protein EZV62_004007 [Acer yangbiense]|uniref:Uncharacterized protein n=1 Tax=Acer yangbiense TaxID=1000413 RepID=A0A5C7IKF5_9ROSI|nr:hypothetical protein EZV62_004007 [Acer yangbiense]
MLKQLFLCCYAVTNEENENGCEIWSRGTQFIKSNANNSRKIYMQVEPKEKKWWIWIIIAVAGGLGGEVVDVINHCSRSCLIGTSVLLPVLSNREETQSKRLRQKGNQIGEKVNSKHSKHYRLRLLGHIRSADNFNVKHLIPYNGDSALEDEGVLNSRPNSIQPEEDNVELIANKRPITTLTTVVPIKVIGHKKYPHRTLCWDTPSSASGPSPESSTFVELQHNQLHLLLLVLELLWLSVGLLLPLLGTTANAEHQVESGLLLDVVVGQSAAILKLLAGKDEALLVRRDSLFVLDLSLDVVDGVRGLHLQGDGLTLEGFHKDLHLDWFFLI